MTIGTVVKVISGALTGETGVIINTGEGYGYGEGRYILYFVKIGSGKYATVYQFKANEVTTA